MASQNADDLKILYKILFIELPTVAAKKALGVGRENELEKTAWEGYDASIRLAGVATSQIYSHPLFGDLLERVAGPLLRVQRLSNVAAGAIFSALWSTMGLPTAADVQSLRGELTNLRREVRLMAGGLLIPGGSEEAPSDIERRAPRRKKREAA
ncbi:MAG TPA: hypothetical protein VMB26_15325 [Candidatus Binataceae bacterium]|nr:hypothetical protein [Candidatus Binataceae bacterium]